MADETTPEAESAPDGKTPGKKPVEKPRLKGATGAIASVVGAVVAGQRPKDPLIRAVAAGGFAAVLCVLLLREWRSDREAERALRVAVSAAEMEQRSQQHLAMTTLLRDQHQEDLRERRHSACVADQLNDTVRAAIWREKPRERKECP